MEDQLFVRVLVGAGLIILGALMLGLSLWARSGVSQRSRRWIDEYSGDNTHHERMVVLGFPALGALLILLGIGLIPVIGIWVLVVTSPVLLALALLTLLAAMTFLRLPDLFYPRWARASRARNLETERRQKEFLRRHR